MALKYMTIISNIIVVLCLLIQASRSSKPTRSTPMSPNIEMKVGRNGDVYFMEKS